MSTASAIPGPATTGFMGAMPGFRRDSLAYLKTVRDYKPLGFDRFGPFPVVFLNSPEALHQVLVEDAANYHKTRITRDVLGKTIGNGLVVSEGDFWKRQRKLVQPAFHHKRIESYGDTMVSHTRRMVDTLQQRVNQTIAIDEAMMALTLEIICKTMFDADVSDTTDEISGIMDRAQQRGNRMFNRLFQIPWWLPTSDNRTGWRDNGRLREIIMGFINERRASREDTGDLLSMLLMAQDEDGSQMTDQQVYDECVTLFIAGHETTALTLIWAWSLLAQNPDVEARLHTEVDTVLAGRTPALSDLPNLPYTEMVVKETLRLYPAAWLTSREPLTDTTIQGFPVKKGTTVMVPFYNIQRDPAFWDAPDSFRPERFSKENEKAITKYTYLPFGAGPRVCIGNMFSLMESRLILATMAQRFRFRLTGAAPQPQPLITLRADRTVTMRVEERQPVREMA